MFGHIQRFAATEWGGVSKPASCRKSQGDSCHMVGLRPLTLALLERIVVWRHIDARKLFQSSRESLTIGRQLCSPSTMRKKLDLWIRDDRQLVSTKRRGLPKPTRDIVRNADSSARCESYSSDHDDTSNQPWSGTTTGGGYRTFPVYYFRTFELFDF